MRQIGVNSQARQQWAYGDIKGNGPRVHHFSHPINPMYTTGHIILSCSIVSFFIFLAYIE